MPQRHPRQGSRTAILAVCLLTGLAALGGGGPSGAAGSTPAAGLEVAPGVYLAAASDSPVPAARPPSLPAPHRFIVGGQPGNIARWPWQVSLGYLPASRTNDWKNHSCGGSLVAPTIVVTAAHCVTLGPNRDFKPPSDFRVITGRTKLSSSQGQAHALAGYYYFTDGSGQPLWDPETMEWDVVFLQLATPSNQPTIKIAGPGEAGTWLPGYRSFVTGWGVTSEDAERGPDVLRQARIRMISDSKCDSVYGPVLMPSVMACAGDLAGGVDACAGDSGGPLVVPVAGGGYRLVGDVSFGAGCGTRGVPGVYGRLASDPIRGALKEGVEAVTGVNVVGSGATGLNTFGFGRRVQYPRSGTAHVFVRVPGRGVVSLAGTKRVRAAQAYPVQSGSLALEVRARGKARRHLDRAGSANVTAKVTYEAIASSAPRTKSTRVRLLKRTAPRR
jgi:hypothetical protein